MTIKNVYVYVIFQYVKNTANMNSVIKLNNDNNT